MKILVCGAEGFIGTNLVTYLKHKGHRVIGADIKQSSADGVTVDLRDPQETKWLFRQYGPFDEVYQLAADMGGMGFIQYRPAQIVRNNMAINANMARMAIHLFEVPRFFFSSSVCVYPDMDLGAPQLREEDAHPAHPDNEYGWEKLMAEILYYTHGDKGTHVRIARFQNTYGLYSDWNSERAKAPAALCYKAVIAPDGGKVAVWGDGKAVRSYTHVSDLLDGVWILMHSDERRPTNIGSSQLITVDQLAGHIIKASGKDLDIVHIAGPQGVRYRDFSKERIRAMGWKETVPIACGIQQLYTWIEAHAPSREELGL